MSDLKICLIIACIFTIAAALILAVNGYAEQGVLACFFMSLVFNLTDAIKRE